MLIRWRITGLWWTEAFPSLGFVVYRIMHLQRGCKLEEFWFLLSFHGLRRPLHFKRGEKLAPVLIVFPSAKPEEEGGTLCIPVLLAPWQDCAGMRFLWERSLVWCVKGKRLIPPPAWQPLLEAQPQWGLTGRQRIRGCRLPLHL